MLGWAMIKNVGIVFHKLFHAFLVEILAGTYITRKRMRTMKHVLCKGDVCLPHAIEFVNVYILVTHCLVFSVEITCIVCN